MPAGAKKHCPSRVTCSNSPLKTWEALRAVWKMGRDCRIWYKDASANGRLCHFSCNHKQGLY